MINKGVKDTLVFPEFDDIKVSTKTFIVKTNITINLEKLFNFLPVTDYIMIPKKRGRKKKVEHVNPNKDIADGSIITMKFENNLKGVDLKEKKTQKEQKQQKKRDVLQDLKEPIYIKQLYIKKRIITSVYH
jgi:hypothetical protein